MEKQTQEIKNQICDNCSMTPIKELAFDDGDVSYILLHLTPGEIEKELCHADFEAFINEENTFWPAFKEVLKLALADSRVKGDSYGYTRIKKSDVKVR